MKKPGGKQGQRAELSAEQRIGKTPPRPKTLLGTDKYRLPKDCIFYWNATTAKSSVAPFLSFFVTHYTSGEGVFRSFITLYAQSSPHMVQGPST